MSASTYEIAGTKAGGPDSILGLSQEANRGFALPVESEITRGSKLFLLSDFGDGTAQGEYVSAAVSIGRDQRVISDIISIPDIGALSIQHGAWVTKQQLKREHGAVCVTVVDPGVGTAREAVSIVTKDRNVIIAPNNGVGFPAAVEHGIEQVYELSADKIEALTGKPITETFHGRDLFAPAGALVSSGVNLADFATPMDIEKLIEFELEQKSLLHIDQFGNLKISDEIPAGATSLQVQRRRTDDLPAIIALIPIFPRFADARVGTLCAYTGSSGGLEIAVNQGRADKALSTLDLRVGQILNYNYGFDYQQFRSQQPRKI